MRIRIASYNIHKGIGGVDRRYRLERIVEALEHYAPDIVLLQEVDTGAKRSGRDQQASILSSKLNLPHFEFQQNVYLSQGGYGNAILSRFPIRERRDIDLTLPPKKRRRALLAHLEIDRGDDSLTNLVAICAHLGLASFERKWQIDRLLKHPRFKRLNHETPIVFGGDFNDAATKLKPMLAATGFELAGNAPNTFPAAFPLVSLDAMYARGAIEIERTMVGDTASAKTASDHRPLIVDFELV